MKQLIYTVVHLQTTNRMYTRRDGLEDISNDKEDIEFWRTTEFIHIDQSSEFNSYKM